MRNATRKQKTLAEKLAQYPDFVRGSVTSVCSTCNRARCICPKKSCPRRAYRLTYKDRQQKTRTVYVRQQQLPKVRKMIANYAQVRKIIEQLVEANIEVFKAKVGR
jgi:uncharacterized protein DUF6788